MNDKNTVVKRNDKEEEKASKNTDREKKKILSTKDDIADTAPNVSKSINQSASGSGACF